jgi:hypothetical protein
MMFDTRKPDFPVRYGYPHGMVVRDKLGRRIRNVVACNPWTGEVIRNRHLSPWFWFGGFLWRPDPCSDSYLFLGIQWFRISVSYHYEVAFPLCHGFWPAPLKTERKRPPTTRAAGFQP